MTYPVKCIYLVGIMLLVLSSFQEVSATAFKSATVTEIINDVKVIKGAQKPTPAKVKETITSQDIIRTGRDSRTELRFQDNTLARVGSNSIFSFTADKREIDLKQGSVLFNSDKGKGGGQIKTAAATAAVTGTTIIVVATANGGFKLLILEGKSRIILPGGVFVDLQAGQMTFINPGQQTRPEILSFDLEALIKGSRLVEGFTDPLDSMEKVQSAVDKQNQLIADGKLDETGQLIVFVNEEGEVQIIDMNSLTQILDIDIIAKLTQDSMNQLTPLDFTALTAAFSQNYVQPTAIIDPNRIFTDVALLKASPFNAGGFYNSAPNTAAYLPANNIDFTTGFIDFSPYQASGTFFFAAEGNITFNTASLELMDPINEVGFIAKGDLIFPTAISIFGGVSNSISKVVFRAGGSMSIPGSSSFSLYPADVSITLGGNFIAGSNSINSANLDITVDGNINIMGGNFYANAGDLHLGALGNLSVSGGSVLNASSGNVNIDSNGALIDISGSSITANQLNINNTSPMGVISMNNVALFSPMTAITMQAYTINLANIDFPAGSSVNLKSGLGMLAPSPNTSASSMSGYVNFINNVDYNGSPAQNEVPTTQGGSAPPTGAIQISTIP